MLPRSKFARVLIFALPLVLAAVLLLVARNQKPRFIRTPAMAQALALSGDGSQLAIAAENGQIFWYANGILHEVKTDNATPFHSAFANGSPPSVQFSSDGTRLPNGNLFLSGDNVKTAYAWDLPSGKPNA